MVPSGNSSFGSYSTLKKLTFEAALAPGISNSCPWGGYVYFLGPHIFMSNNNNYCVCNFFYSDVNYTQMTKLLPDFCSEI